jgi:Bacteriophage HK97-gp10, putative tail-component
MNLRLEGLDALRAAVHTLPADLARETRPEVVAAAEATASALRAAYPVRTGNLRRGVRVRLRTTATGTKATVQSTAPYALYWEYGTQIRRTQRGWNRGAAPAHAGQGLHSLAARRRTQLLPRVVDVLERHNFRVSG